jgi:transcriptional regulator
MKWFYETLSEQERKVFYYKMLGMKQKEISKELGVASRYVSVLLRRIKTKATKLGINLEEVGEIPMDEIMQCYLEDQLRTIPKKTVKQAQFLQEKTTHLLRTSKDTPAERRMRSRLGVKRKNDAYIIVRKCTEEERKRFNTQSSQEIPPHIMKMNREYDYYLATGSGTTQELATMEMILRSYGVILLTPHINKLNAKTTLVQRADTVVVVKSGEESILNGHNPKFIESTTNEDGVVEKIYTIQGQLPKIRRTSVSPD